MNRWYNTGCIRPRAISQIPNTIASMEMMRQAYDMCSTQLEQEEDMTRKHFEKIAKVLGRYYKFKITMDQMIWQLVAIFKDDNPRFDEDRFVDAILKE